MSEKRVIITGATGMVGGCALRLCLENPDVSQVTVIGRSPTGINDAILREVVVDAFADYSGLEDTLKNQDTALYCLGAYTGAVPDDLFRQITVDYTLAFARSLHRASPQATFCFLSGQGADQTEKSRMAFARYKGAAETALLDIGFPRVHIFRPGYIYPVTPRKEPNLVYTISRFLCPCYAVSIPISASPPRTWPGQWSMPAYMEQVELKIPFWRTKTFDSWRDFDTYLERIVNETNVRHPDLVLLNRDLVDNNAALASGVMSALARFEAPVCVTTGNHEYYVDTDRALEIYANHKKNGRLTRGSYLWQKENLA